MEKSYKIMKDSLDFNFENKTVIVTGGASGMGNMTGKRFANLSANVVLVDVNEKVLAEKVDEIKNLGQKAIGLKCDVRNYSEIQKVCKEVYERFGSIDIMINAAGGTAKRILNHPEDLLDTPMEVIDWGIDVNLKGQLYFGIETLKYMKKRNSGVIINFGSVTGEEGDKWGIDYAVAKSGVMGGLTKSLALYGAECGVRCCCVSPGPIMTRPGMAGMTTLLKKAGQPEDVVNMILYLCSDYANFITGTNYFIDGGRVICPDKTWGKNNV